MKSKDTDLRQVASEISKMNPDNRTQHYMIEKEIGNNGTTRRAYKIKGLNRVIKIAVTKGAQNENYEEIQMWMKLKSTRDKNLFCPIRDKSKNCKWLIMDFAEPIRQNSGILISEIKRSIFSRKVEKTVDKHYDVSTDNLGYHENLGTVIFDYPWGSHIEEYDIQV